jgi:cell division protein FtsQ
MTLHKVENDGSVADAVVDSAALFGRRRWSRRLRSWRPMLLGVLLVLVVGFLTWVVFASTWLGMRHLDVEGLHRVTEAEVAAAADVAPGTPLARVDLDAVQARVEAIPAVAAATVHRGWPHTIGVTVTERRPVAAVHSGDGWWLMDRTGALFEPTPDPQPGQTVVEVGPGAGPETLRQVASVLGLMPADLAARTLRVTASTEDSITLQLSGGAEVRWGSASASAEKARVLQALVHHKASYYDVSVPSQPATKD